ncbi:hypothetical protein Btru_057695 [Bulinus truncatus]|nr:hypothetical protein Btru_057695 [Bulinus truncatus]
MDRITRIVRGRANTREGVHYTQQLASFDEFLNFINSQSREDAEKVTSIKLELFPLSLLSGDSLQLPINIGRFVHLHSLTVSGCGLTNLPWSIIYLKSLVKFDLSYNKLMTLPNYFGTLSSLEYLNLEGNRLIVLPTSLIELTNLKTLNLAKNDNLMGPSYNICMQGIDAVMKALSMRSSRKNMWANSKMFYDPSDALPNTAVELPTLVALCINVIHQSGQDFLLPVIAPSDLNELFQTKLDEKRKSLSVAKCSTCHAFFSNVTAFESHVCKQDRGQCGQADHVMNGYHGGWTSTHELALEPHRLVFLSLCLSLLECVSFFS